MFNKDELNFILLTIDAYRSRSTQESRNKGYMMIKISNLLDEPEPEEVDKVKEEITEDD